MNESVLKRLLDQQFLSPLSYFFARFIAQHAHEPEDSPVAMTAALVAEQNQQGDVCLELPRFAGQPIFSDARAAGIPRISLPALAPWQAVLMRCACVGAPGEHKPLILDGERLYLARFWRYEEQVASGLTARANAPTDFDPLRLQEGLARLFPSRPGEQINWQKVASALAVSRRFAVISGGPGTGKTTTVIKVLALLLEQNPALQILLAAPTGKAATRMVESLRSRKHDIDMDETIAGLIPDHASTLHRLLAFDGRRFRHNGENPLTADCLVIDEASMIDLSMMARLLDAIPANCRLILLGDRDQLASVDAGNVLGDITGHGKEISYSTAQAQLLADLAGVPIENLPQVCLPSHGNWPADAVALLRTSYRFHAESDIGRLARLVNTGDGMGALELLRASPEDDLVPASNELSWLPGEGGRLNPRALDWAVERYEAYLQSQDITTALAIFDRTRVLCAMHAGELGEDEFNRRVEERLAAMGLLTGGDLCHGKPIMVTVNDYEVDLFNGDIGLLWRNKEDELRAWFPQVNGEVRSLAAINLPQFKPAWALTIHKSQGSEFDEVLLVLPQDVHSPLLSRELIYTGITRARQRVVVHGSDASFIKGCETHVQRSSGLADRLGWSAPLP